MRLKKLLTDFRTGGQMDIITTKRSGMSQTQRDRIRQQHINSSQFDPAWIGESGPVFMVLSCGFNTDKYRGNYDKVEWDK